MWSCAVHDPVQCDCSVASKAESRLTQTHQGACHNSGTGSTKCVLKKKEGVVNLIDQEEVFGSQEGFVSTGVFVTESKGKANGEESERSPTGIE